MLLVKRVEASKVENSDFKIFVKAIKDHNEKIKHISVFVSEMSKILLPNKGYGTFKQEVDLHASIESREKVIK